MKTDKKRNTHTLYMVSLSHFISFFSHFWFSHCFNMSELTNSKNDHLFRFQLLATRNYYLSIKFVMNVNRIILRMKIQKKSKAFWLDSPLKLGMWIRWKHWWNSLVNGLFMWKTYIETWNGIEMFKKSVFFYLLRISFHYTQSNSHRSSDIKNRFWSMDDFERHSCNISYSNECDHLFRAQREYIF